MSKMYLIAYNPPKGTPPFEFTHNGTIYTFMPPDMYWRKVEEEYVIGDIIHPASGHVLRQKMGKRKVWQPDPALTTQMKVRPNNTRWLSQSAWNSARKAKYVEFNRYLEDITSAQDRQQTALLDLQKVHEEKVLQLQSTYEENIAAMERAYDLEAQKKQAEMRDQMMDKARELGMTFEAFQRAVELAAAQLSGDTKGLDKAQKQLDKNVRAQ